MGEELYEELAKLEEAIGDPRTPVRIYAPVGSHKDLLAYLVRRLLENGANSSFVNRIADEDVPSTIWCAIRSPTSPRSSRSAIRRSRCPTTSSAQRAATAPASTSATRWCASRCCSG